MGRPLESIKVVEVAMWAFVPAAGGILSDLGADVIKIEPPTGDPIRGLKIGSLGRAPVPFDLSWEAYNRGKRSVTLDLKMPEGLAVLHRLLEDADVFLTNLLPPARARMKIDEASIRARFPNLIYATGSGLGQQGPEAHKGGFDAITFWARGGIASSLTEDGAAFPASPPGPAFGDCLSGAMLAGAISAAIAKRALSGEASSVDVSLLGTAMWSMQRAISQATLQEVARLPRPTRDRPNNVLVYNYRTADGRFVALNMLQADRYWGRLLHLAGRDDLAEDPRYVTMALRAEHVEACVHDLRDLFASKSLAEWQDILARQDGQWDVVKNVGELKDDCQAQANGYIQQVAHDDGLAMPVVSVPMQFDGASFAPRRAPTLGEHSDAVLAALGYDEDAVIDLKVAGAVL